eukprot:TRINITY_DN778_c0_g1_i2.p1 TRINITY_DN778_c0_g1~~TRINITY_DN778_c0_g1_i2.p1  ORF type:complete len:111 (+),score=16.06 TRINITY_DN778_c0_g1_i2:87-419(+)
MLIFPDHHLLKSILILIPVPWCLAMVDSQVARLLLGSQATVLVAVLGPSGFLLSRLGPGEGVSRSNHCGGRHQSSFQVIRHCIRSALNELFLKERSPCVFALLFVVGFID